MWIKRSDGRQETEKGWKKGRNGRHCTYITTMFSRPYSKPGPSYLSCPYSRDINSSDQQTFSTCTVEALKVIELLGSWYCSLTSRLSLSLSHFSSLSLANDQHAEGRGGVRLPLGPRCIVWCMAIVLCFMRMVSIDLCVYLLEGGRYTQIKREEVPVVVCVFLNSYTQKVSMIYAARLSSHLESFTVIFFFAIQCVRVHSPCIKHEANKPASKSGSCLLESWTAHWHTLSPLVRYSHTDHGNTVCSRVPMLGQRLQINVILGCSHSNAKGTEYYNESHVGYM